MKKIKYQGAITKILATKIGNTHRKKFISNLSNSNDINVLFEKINTLPQISVDIVSFSSNADYPEQLLSIFSFVRYIGIPSSWTIYSDGTHSEHQITNLKNAIPFASIVIKNYDDDTTIRSTLKENLKPWANELIHYAKKSAFGKKLLNNLNHPVRQPTIFLDSDVLFYKWSAPFLRNQRQDKVNGYFLPDAEWGNLDKRYKTDGEIGIYQVNSGFFILNRELEHLNGGLDFLKKIEANYEYFTEQTVFHILLTGNNFFPLDPRIFVLNTDDQFEFSYFFQRSKMAIRHYTSPVRHKMWQKNWKWHLSI